MRRRATGPVGGNETQRDRFRRQGFSQHFILLGWSTGPIPATPSSIGSRIRISLGFSSKCPGIWSRTHGSPVRTNRATKDPPERRGESFRLSGMRSRRQQPGADRNPLRPRDRRRRCGLHHASRTQGNTYPPSCTGSATASSTLSRRSISNEGVTSG